MKINSLTRKKIKIKKIKDKKAGVKAISLVIIFYYF